MCKIYLEKCCCGLTSLRNGSLIFAGYSLILAIYFLTVTIRQGELEATTSKIQLGLQGRVDRFNISCCIIKMKKSKDKEVFYAFLLLIIILYQSLTSFFFSFETICQPCLSQVLDILAILILVGALLAEATPAISFWLVKISNIRHKIAGHGSYHLNSPNLVPNY